MALTFCTFSRELKSYFARKTTNTEIVQLLFSCLPDKPSFSKSTCDALMSGRRQIPAEVRKAVGALSLEEMTEFMNETVIPRLHPVKKIDLFENISELLADDVLFPESELENVNHYIAGKNLGCFLATTYHYADVFENSNPDMFIHKAAPLAPWDEMPDFSIYLSRIQESFSKIRTLLYYDNPKPFYDFYVCNDISAARYFLFSFREEGVYRQLYNGIENATIKKLGEFSNYIIIMGTGGLGKSMMMRNLLLNSVNSFEEDGMIPVFVPLKDYTQEDIDLLDYIYDKFTDDGKHTEISKEQFEDTLRHSRFQILLDGYDEIKTNCVNSFERSLKKFMRKYSNNFYILSSRPFDFDNVSAFRRFLMTELEPFTKEQSLQLIDKLEFRPDEPSIKQKFAQQLDENLYNTHREFASNPLLLTIMLMTFEQFAEVPSKMHVFYREAYATLSQKHDASKGAYKRALKTGLSANRFADYFAEFCARTYSDEKYEMTRDEIIDYFNKLNTRKKSNDPEFTADDFIYDLHHNLCLLYHESGKYHFTHRSFQEYFCALYFSRQKDKALEKIGESFEKRSTISFSDKTFHMLYDMIPEKVEEYIFLPYLKKLFDECSGEDGYWTYLAHHIKDIHSSRRVGLRNRLYMYPGSESFIGEFITRFPAHGKVVRDSIEFPYYKEFVSEEYDIYTDPDGEEHAMPTGYGEGHVPKRLTKTDKKAYEYHFNLVKLAKARDKYPDLVAVFESDQFQPYVDFMAMKTYYEKLTANIDEGEDDSLDFL